MKMRFIYFYSPFYQFYHEHIQSALSSHFDLEPILIEDIQEIENKNLHHFEGLTIKLDLIIAAIKRYMGEIIVFSDATIFINHNKAHELQAYILENPDLDIVFVNEYSNGQNIGVLRITCSEKMLDFFEKSLQIMKDGIETHDQNAIKRALSETNTITSGLFGDRIMCQHFYEYMRPHFYIFKSFISNRGKESNFNQRLQQFYDLQLIDEATYNKWSKTI
jgi:hypothetical protein